MGNFDCFIMLFPSRRPMFNVPVPSAALERRKGEELVGGAENQQRDRGKGGEATKTPRENFKEGEGGTRKSGL